VSVGFVVLFCLGALLMWLARGAPPAAAAVALGSGSDPVPASVAVRRGGQVAALRRLQDLARRARRPQDTDGVTVLEASLLNQARTARSTAAFAQRGERLVALFAILATLAVASAVALSSAQVRVPRPNAAGVNDGLWPLVRPLMNGGVAVITLLGITVIGAMAGGAATRGRRPLGLAWDLMCFLPRTGHPLGPPCYAERAVPEIVRRVEWWLDAERSDGSEPPSAHRRQVVLSAHSLGGVLAVAAVCACAPRIGGRDTVARLQLITYGSQLRPYFGRLFPDLLGPAVQGTRPVPAPTWWGANPWRESDETIPSALAGSTVRAVLHGNWRNLWRRSDPIGFPVDAYPAGGVDRAAEEFDTSRYVVKVDGHSDYQRTLVYLDELDQAVRRALTPAAEDGWKGSTISLPQAAPRASTEAASTPAASGSPAPP
jgi:hypothetical protein